MTRRAFLLTGLAMLAVVFAHSTLRGFNAMFWWTDRYRDVTVPNFDQVGTLSYYTLVVILRLASFAIPAFLFASGFFVVYALRGGTAARNWKIIRSRLTYLIAPYLIWSVTVFTTDWLESCLQVCQSDTWYVYLWRLLSGDAKPAYWYIPLICQLYLLSPWLVRWAERRCRLLLGITAVIHVVGLILLNLHRFVIDITPVNIIFAQGLFPRDIFYFVLGIAGGINLKSFSGWLRQHRRSFFAGTLVLAGLSVLEGEFVFFLTSDYARGAHSDIIASAYAVVTILFLLASSETAVPYAREIYQVGRKTYGIYLLHPPAMHFTSRIVYNLLPWALGIQLIYQPIMIAAGLGLPLFLMALVARSPLRKYYRYLFG